MQRLSRTHTQLTVDTTNEDMNIILLGTQNKIKCQSVRVIMGPSFKSSHFWQFVVLLAEANAEAIRLLDATRRDPKSDWQLTTALICAPSARAHARHSSSSRPSTPPLPPWELTSQLQMDGRSSRLCSSLFRSRARSSVYVRKAVCVRGALLSEPCAPEHQRFANRPAGQCTQTSWLTSVLSALLQCSLCTGHYCTRC